jgi:hypothetical protein
MATGQRGVTTPGEWPVGPAAADCVPCRPVFPNGPLGVTLTRGLGPRIGLDRSGAAPIGWPVVPGPGDRMPHARVLTRLFGKYTN